MSMLKLIVTKAVLLLPFLTYCIVCYAFPWVGVALKSNCGWRSGKDLNFYLLFTLQKCVNFT